MEVTDEERAAAAAVLDAAAEEAEALRCATCGKGPYTSERNLAAHVKSAHGEGAARSRERNAARPAARTLGDAAVREVIGKTVANLITIGGYVTILAPHTGLALAGVPTADGASWVVRSRAVQAGDLLEAHAKRDPRVLVALQRFNGFFEGSAAAELALSMGAAVAVDAGLVDPHMSLEIGPFTGENAIRPVEAVIGDVIAEVDRLRGEYQAAAAGEPAPEPEPSPNGRPRRRTKGASSGGVTDT